MGRLLAKLMQESASAANPANVANLDAWQGRDSQIRKIRSEGAAQAFEAPGNGFVDSQDSLSTPVDQSVRLLAAIRAAGLPDELLARDDSMPEQLSALGDDGLRSYVTALGWSADIDAGRVPSGWDRQGHCEGCGTVVLPPGHVAHCIACPWCARRKAGKPIPRPHVTCGSCRHFIRNPVNPAAGGGDCAAGVEYLGGAGPWPNVTRRCGLHRPLEDDDGEA